MNASGGYVLAVDPGSAKAGYALVSPDGTVVASGIAPVAALRATLASLCERHRVEAVALGRGTRSETVAAMVSDLGPPVHLVDEFESSRRARELYFREHPPRGWRRLVPIGLQLPPRPIDDYAAILIGLRFLSLG